MARNMRIRAFTMAIASHPLGFHNHEGQFRSLLRWQALPDRDAEIRYYARGQVRYQPCCFGSDPTTRHPILLLLSLPPHSWATPQVMVVSDAIPSLTQRVSRLWSL